MDNRTVSQIIADGRLSTESFQDVMDKVIGAISLSEPFLAILSMRIPKVYTDDEKNMPTAAVGATKHRADRMPRVTMFINRHFFLGMTHKQRIGVMMHELFHVALAHIADRKAVREQAKLWNIATDLAINSLIDHDQSGKLKEVDALRLPGFTLLPGRMLAEKEEEADEDGEKRKPTAAEIEHAKKFRDLIASFPALQSSDFYMKKLRELQDQSPGAQMGFGYGSMDDHSSWGVDPDMEDVISEEIRGMIREAATHARSANQWGSVSADMQKAIDEYLRSEVDWRAVLKMFHAKTRALDPVSTMRRVNKRAPYKMPGTRRDEIAQIVWFIDQSGSMGDDDVARGLAEGLNCSRTGQIDIMNFDTSIDEGSFHTVKRGSGFKWLRTRCGGTDFDCVADYLNDLQNKNKYSGAVVVTDGYAPKMKHCKTPILWLVTPGGTMETVRPGDLVIRMGSGEQVRRHVG